ncbi:MAG: S-layer homology domain-containing protein [Bacillota bacterium]|jgi:hypothetical protein
MYKHTKRTIVFVTAVIFLVFLLPGFAFADNVSLTLNPIKVAQGGEITASGQADPNVFVSVKVLDSTQGIVFYDAIKSGADKNYSLTFKAPAQAGEYLVVAGYGSNVASKSFIVKETTQPGGDFSGGNTGGGGGSGSSEKEVTSTNGKAEVTPSAGGTVSLGSEVTVKIPANALTGTQKVDIIIEKVTDPPAAPTGFRILGSVFEFKVGSNVSYSFNKPVTLTFTFAQTSLNPGEVSEVYYYDQIQGRWVNLGGKVSGNTITVEVNHFTKFALLTKVAQETTLNDIAGHWAEQNINQLVNFGAINGYPDGSFMPNNRITRAEFAAVLVKAFKLTKVMGQTFTDTESHWAEDYIGAAAENGVVKGYDTGAFGPDDLITREQMAVMVVQAAKLSGAAEVLPFDDSDRISDWAKEAVAIATGNGIMKGYPDNTIQPRGNATRAEAVTVILNALKNNESR